MAKSISHAITRAHVIRSVYCEFIVLNHLLNQSLSVSDPVSATVSTAAISRSKVDVSTHLMVGVELLFSKDIGSDKLGDVDRVALEGAGVSGRGPADAAAAATQPLPPPPPPPAAAGSLSSSLKRGASDKGLASSSPSSMAAGCCADGCFIPGEGWNALENGVGPAPENPGKKDKVEKKSEKNREQFALILS